MDIWILNMIKNKNCGIPDKIYLECVAILGCICLLRFTAYIFISEVCYNISLWETIDKIIVWSAIVLIVLIKVRKYFIYKNNRISLERNKKLVQATFDAKEFKALHLRGIRCSYCMVGYYTEGDRTYRFECKIYDKQIALCDVFWFIHKKGVFPSKMGVYVDSTDYNNYQMQVYEFLDATLKMNKELAEYAYVNVRHGIDIGQWKREKEERERK